MPGPYLIDDDGVGNTACESPLQRKVVRDFDGHFHCVYQKIVGGFVHPFYSKSEDMGVTWSDPLDLMPGSAVNHSHPSIAINEYGTIHVLFEGPPHYRYYQDGVWSDPRAISIGFSGNEAVGPTFIPGETVQGQTSGREAVCLWRDAGGAGWMQIGVSNPYNFGAGEWILGLTSGKRMRNDNNLTGWTRGNIAVNSRGALEVTVNYLAVNVFHVVPYAPPLWNHGCMTEIGTGSPSTWRPTSAIGPGNRVHIVGHATNNYEHVCGTWGAHYDPGEGGFTNEYSICPGATANWQDPAIAVDLAGNLHVVMAQTGLGGTNPAILNVKLYTRSSGGTWTGPEHVTDETVQCIDPTIAVDHNDVITVVFRSRIGGLGNDAIFMRQKSGGSWGSIETIIQRTGVGQEEINLLHSLWPKIGYFRPNYPDGYAFIFNGYVNVPAPGSSYYTVEFYHDIHQALAPPPTDLLCEQKTNPSDVQDPNPEFSAVYHERK